MTQHVRRLLIAAAAFTVVAITVLVVTLVHGSGSSPPAGGIASDHSRTIAAGGGVTLAAEVITPAGGGRHPLVVMPGSWGQPETEYRAIGRSLATSGYQVVAYAQRGFAKSTGAVDFAGTATQRDASTVITWAIAHTPADPKHVGMVGISYGAGIALLAAAHDKRVRAVGALSTWSDVAESFDPQSTPSGLGLRLLLGAAKETLRLTPEAEQLRRTLTDDPAAVGDVIRALSPERSPMTYLAQLNANRPAIMLANAYEDSIFAPGQLVAFYTGLTGPKRLQLAAGDHGGPELGALFGRANSTVDDVHAWLDHYLRDYANGVDDERPVELRDAVTDQVHGFAAWPDPATAATGLGRPGQADNTGRDVTHAWTITLPCNTDSAATSGSPAFLSAAAYAPPQLAAASLDGGKAAVWTGPAVTSDTLVSGTARVRVRIAGSGPVATAFFYLYDVGTDGNARLMSTTPFTATGLTAVRAVTIPLEPTAWTVRAGHHLLLAADTHDDRYQSLTPAGATVTLSSTAAEPASITVPTA